MTELRVRMHMYVHIYTLFNKQWREGSLVVLFLLELCVCVCVWTRA